MESDGGFGFWAFAIVGGPILLGLAVAYGIARSRRKSRALKQISEQATEGNYRAEERREKALERQDRI